MKSAALFSCLFAAVYIHKSIVVLPWFFHSAYARTMRGKMSVCPSVCPPVCLSHAGIALKRLNVFSSFFTVCGFIILVFFQSIPNVIAIFRRYPKGVECRVGMKNIAIFDQYRFISEMTQDRTIERQYTGIRMRSIERCYFQ